VAAAPQGAKAARGGIEPSGGGRAVIGEGSGQRPDGWCWWPGGQRRLGVPALKLGDRFRRASWWWLGRGCGPAPERQNRSGGSHLRGVDQRRTWTEAAPVTGGWTREVGGGSGARQWRRWGGSLCGGGGSGAGLYVVAAVDWAHTENFCRCVRCREGVKARRYENFTIVEGPTYSCRFTDECTAMYIHRLID
jgi:hypothetical protein